MARIVRVAPGAGRIVLPNGGSYTDGQTVTLSEEEFDRLDPDVLGSLVTRDDSDLGSISERLAALEAGGSGSGTSGVFLASTYGMAPGNTAAENGTAFAAVVAAAKAAKGEVLIPAGTYNYDTAPNLDWSGGIIRGHGPEQTILNQTSTTENGINVKPSAAIFQPTVRDLTLAGPSSGTGIGVDIVASSGSINAASLTNVRVRNFGSHALQSSFTDYLKLDRVALRNCGGSGWVAQVATNASVAIASAFLSNGNAGVLAEDMDTAHFIGCEFGSQPYGFKVAGAGNGQITFTGCRMEVMTTRFVEVGDGTGVAPSRLRFDGCYFLGDSALTPMINLNGVTDATFRECGTGQLPPGGVFIKAQISTNNNNIVIENCRANSGAHIFQDNGSANDSNRRIVFRGDYTNALSTPFGLVLPVAATISATGTFTIGLTPRALQVQNVYLTLDQTIAADGANFWSVVLKRYSAGVDQGTLFSATSAAGWSARRFSSATLGAQVNFSGGDVIVAEVTKTGTPAPLEDLVAMLTYRPS